ncbi:MAG: hypothetical protein AAFV59_01650 [Pseudomonadota bacterium]
MIKYILLTMAVSLAACNNAREELERTPDAFAPDLSVIVEARTSNTKCESQEYLFEDTSHFGSLAQLTGRCYLGTPAGDSAEQTRDIQHWSFALGGAAITIEHALEDGSYGGISYVYPAAEPGEFTYVYITNAGFHTQGTIVINEDQSFTASETVTGHPTITEVRSISRFDESGLTSMTSEFLDDGEWKPGPAFTHEVTTDPFPRLRMPAPVEAE